MDTGNEQRDPRGAAAANPAPVRSSIEHFDVVIVGAGLSGICAAYHLQAKLPHKRFLILEARDAIGGTWDLFRYPGVRSDSDMYTLGYRFRAWRDSRAIADGALIREYIADAAQAYGIRSKIRFRHRVAEAAWDSGSATWRLRAEVGAEGDTRIPVAFTCQFLFMCSGYYDYRAGYLPDWPGMADYAGTLVHPQHWPADLNYRRKRVVVIGSGATAVTLVPAMAQQAAHVTMLQRSPTYMVSRPAEDRLAGWLYRRLPTGAAASVARWKNVLLGTAFFNIARRKPGFTRRLIEKGVKRQLAAHYEARHFTPSYNPWEQRLCLVPDGDFFRAMRDGKASIVTDEIERFTPTGLLLRSGQRLEADIIVTATGLRLQLFGGMKVSVDGVEKNVAESLVYKGMMYSGIPNLASAFGYVNASWTLRCELTAEYVCRLLRHMERRQLHWCMPQRPTGSMPERPVLDLSSGYVRRGADVLPRQGARQPWRAYQNYLRDRLAMRFSRINDGTMRFGRAMPDTKAAQPVDPAPLTAT
ncbi:Predicted flavoprotein CzcO associated with the cation diffusion facilitator CzcD [Noviherbaspirillum humi]|uniref:Predicted flavoprotein CzcO associated with the cation diffusion facilitator CzcD n=1 Tax=Noviherbaspirillum humi TaxID=1688639 RepID=A0A239G689_9BURK|nr:NAD(P)/FAD-dependent oxidoreductase [Noviherbaspirillum humi]SNS64866.1 Predicted flavoprotein CzcO associated with the cation diffusion facilitator CzcD [Noviherbaspirillum humi]